MTEAQMKAQADLLLAIQQQDVLHLIDTIYDVSPNRWICLRLEGNDRTAAFRILEDGSVTGFHGKYYLSESVEIIRGDWTPSQFVGAAVAWMEVGFGGPADE